MCNHCKGLCCVVRVRDQLSSECQSARLRAEAERDNSARLGLLLDDHKVGMSPSRHCPTPTVVGMSVCAEHRRDNSGRVALCQNIYNVCAAAEMEIDRLLK